MVFYAFFFFIVGERLVELAIAKRNERVLKATGAKEFGARHYPWIVAMHALFFVSFWIEATLKGGQLSPWWPFLFSFFTAVQGLRIWTLWSLGRLWNTKILVLPNAHVVVKGPYRWLRHPNYLIVTLEMILIPLLFEAYWTALIFSVLNAFLLSIRISTEEQALSAMTNYKHKFRDRPRFFPFRPVK
ncbi:isoprenylcysteine carboxyl methyltransferase family protein [Thermaerobacillus caldiproteolyticus]|uniref:isoprenylcysteine carboxyl methyltransferase family protein n=1 Tax=Thermaerobacillus caldiproteolyticus TaxID=247480 RepID=UPI00188D9093|nr:isoprenylcysteine carboxylmethyltransferase family protein [Anoxybacillus caldiproteolyticus]QPA32729.1 hypothetical protein ISX45_07385 [Anoxybacillus caldiproteolyticus]